MASNSTVRTRRQSKGKGKASPSLSPDRLQHHHDLKPRARTDETGLFVVRRQAELSLSVATALVALAGLFPSRFTVSTSHTRTPTLHQHSLPAKFLFLSYEDPTTGLYYKGRDDAALVIFWILAFTFLRIALRRWVWEPLARFGGVRSVRKLASFGEQGWNVVYNSVSFFCGLGIMNRSGYTFRRTQSMWDDHPYEALPATTKLYYLVQIGFWIQQFIVLHTEKRRKDHLQMFTHHCFTAFLLLGSYYADVTPVGTAILVLMDPADVFLGLAKMFKYLGFSTLCDATFVVFLVCWIITRHVLFVRMLYSTAIECPWKYPVDWRGTGETKHNLAWYLALGFNVALIALQGLLLMWFAMIMKVAYKVVTGTGADDSRSDTEDDEEVSTPTTPVKASLHAAHSTSSSAQTSLTTAAQRIGEERSKKDG